tara:strand:+ start:2929 stop:3051 length:123 start_codon:yes stop_codon:yes gene_type:complete
MKNKKNILLITAFSLFMFAVIVSKYFLWGCIIICGDWYDE